MNRYISFFIIIVGLFFLSQCREADTCNSVLGDTFQLIVLDTISFDNEANLALQFEWNALEELPDSYFADVALLRGEQDPYRNEWINDHEDLESWEANRVSMTLLLKPSSLPVLNNDREIHLHFRFPDRQDHIDCTHPGSGDSYYFDISFNLKQTAENEFELSMLAWEENFQAGGF